MAEIGTNHPGEIAPLASLVSPTHAILTAIGAEHLEGFATVGGRPRGGARPRARAAARRRRVRERRLRAPRGAPFPTHVRVVRCGFGPRATDVRGAARRGADGTLAVRLDPARPWLETRLQYGVLEHALLARGRGGEASRRAPTRSSSTPRATIGPAPLRGEVKRINGATLLVDCYNSNPLSAAAALREIGSRGRAAQRGPRRHARARRTGAGAPPRPRPRRREGRAHRGHLRRQYGADFEKGLAGPRRAAPSTPPTLDARDSFSRLVKAGRHDPREGLARRRPRAPDRGRRRPPMAELAHRGTPGPVPSGRDPAPAARLRAGFRPGRDADRGGAVGLRPRDAHDA